ncbi:MAG: hypothetical protein JWM16_4601 [Verrucomicrobiales bacterium]|nr:hypothetical protein [Verrucomicrobiales bacterium]
MAAFIASLNRKARNASREGKGWIEPIARLGLMCKGLTYILVGGIGLTAVFRLVPAMGPREALNLFVSHPSGAILLPLIGTGLWAYSFWKLLQATCDPEHRGTQWKAIFVRLGFLGSGCAHLGFGWTAFQLAFGNDHGHVRLEQYWLARLFMHPLGDYLAGIIAAWIAIGGFYQFGRAWKGKFQHRWEVSKQAQDTKHWARYIGQIGLASRGVIFLVIAWLLFQSALHLNAAEAGGVGDALQVLGSLKYGSWLLAIVSMGLLAYGLFELLEAYYCRIYGPVAGSKRE